MKHYMFHAKINLWN